MLRANRNRALSPVNDQAINHENGKRDKKIKCSSFNTIVAMILGSLVLFTCVLSLPTGTDIQTTAYAQTSTFDASPLSLSSSEDAALELDVDDQNTRLHLIFSTDCSTYQHWQSFLLYFSALKVRQPGHVTRIASGCNSNEAAQIQKWFDDYIKPISSRFHLHLTPSFSGVNGKDDYKYFNKPFGVRHWLENSPFIQMNPADGLSPNENDVVILIDPDMVLLRKITANFGNQREVIIGRRKLQNPAPFESWRVEHGKPFAQTYGLGTQWRTLNLTNISGPDSPAKNVKKLEGALYYPAGPPYLATVRDMYQIATKWTEFAPKVYDEYPHLLAEMFAWCIAAAHLGLKHRLVDSLMVSSVGAAGEGWPLVNKIPKGQVCNVAADPQQYPVYAMPAVVHYCQEYAIGKDWLYTKQNVPHDIFTCKMPLLTEPPSNLAELFDWKQPSPKGERVNIKPQNIGGEVFMICALINLINEASSFFKQGHCPAGTATLEKTLRITRSRAIITRKVEQ